jgi:hypothetical protein
VREKTLTGALALLSPRKQAFAVAYLETRDGVAAYRQAFPSASVARVAEAEVAERAERLLAAHDVQAAIREGGALVVGSDTVERAEVIRRARDIFECSIAEGSLSAGVQAVRLLAQIGGFLSGDAPPGPESKAAAQSDAELVAALAQRLKVQAAPATPTTPTTPAPTTAPAPTVGDTGRA